MPDLLNACFDKQIAFINDPSPLKAAFVARRSGKTWAIAVDLIKTAHENPATKCLYYGLTRDSAWNVTFLHMLDPICRQFGIRVQVNRTLQTLEFENRSIIKLTGDDASDGQIDKALGGKYKKVVFDECQAIKHDLEGWVKNKLGPAMVDQDGVIVLAGTAGEHMGERFWYKVTREKDREPGWSVHSWTPFDNPHMAELVRKYLVKRRTENPNLDEDPGYQQEWLCKWVVEREARIYRYDPMRNALDHHDFSNKHWRYLIGVDFGYEDDTAIVVGAYHPHDGRCYLLESFKKKHMLMDELAAEIDARRRQYSPEHIVVDGQNKQFVMSMGARFGIPMRFAQKLGKAEHVAAMNNDFRTSKLMVVRGANAALVEEWDALTWDEGARLRGVFKENASKDNHLADAALYLHHASKHYWTTPAPTEDPHPMRTQAERELRNQMSERGDAAAFYNQLEGVQ
jgi:hypothetical protein